MAAWLGSVIGGVVAGVPFAVLGALAGDAAASGFDEIGTGITYAAYGLFAGGWVGACLGCVIALRIGGHGKSLATALALACLLLAGWLLWSQVLLDMGDLLAIYIPLVGAVVSPVVARAITLPASGKTPRREGR